MLKQKKLNLSSCHKVVEKIVPVKKYQRTEIWVSECVFEFWEKFVFHLEVINSTFILISKIWKYYRVKKLFNVNKINIPEY